MHQLQFEDAAEPQKLLCASKTNTQQTSMLKYLLSAYDTSLYATKRSKARRAAALLRLSPLLPCSISLQYSSCTISKLALSCPRRLIRYMATSMNSSNTEQDPTMSTCNAKGSGTMPTCYAYPTSVKATETTQMRCCRSTPCLILSSFFHRTSATHTC